MLAAVASVALAAPAFAWDFSASGSSSATFKTTDTACCGDATASMNHHFFVLVVLQYQVQIQTVLIQQRFPTLLTGTVMLVTLMNTSQLVDQRKSVTGLLPQVLLSTCRKMSLLEHTPMTAGGTAAHYTDRWFHHL